MKHSKAYIWNIGAFFCLALILCALFPADIWAAARNFNQKKTITIAEEKDFIHTQKFIWIKYKAPNDGYITVTAKDKKGNQDDEEREAETNASGMFQLYDVKKKTQLSREFSYQTDGEAAAYSAAVFGVKKNVTYFLRLQAQGAVSLNCKFTKVGKCSADKKAKAVTLSKDKIAKGILMAGDHAADWYKLSVPKKQYLHFYYAGKANGQIQLTFSGSYLKTTKRYVAQGTEEEGHAYTIERVQPGNYYVKVERADSLSSGFYTLKWQ